MYIHVHVGFSCLMYSQVNNTVYSLHVCLLELASCRFQPEGKGKYIFDIGCQQHGEYVPVEQVTAWVDELLQIYLTRKSSLKFSSGKDVAEPAYMPLMYAKLQFKSYYCHCRIVQDLDLSCSDLIHVHIHTCIHTCMYIYNSIYQIRFTVLIFSPGFYIESC